MPLLEHIRELRDRVMVAGAAFLISTLGCFFFSGSLFSWLIAPMQKALADTGRGTLAMMDTAEGVMVQMKIAGFGGAFLAAPVIFYQIWRFVSPGLYDSEKKWVTPLVVTSTTLFLLGASFAYFVVFPFGFPVMLSVAGEDVQAVLSIEKYLSFATTLMLAFGISYQLPVVVWVLARIGLIDHWDMLRGFRYSTVLIFFVAAILTPPDWIDQLLMAFPLMILYVVGIVVAWAATTKKRDPNPDSPPTES